MSVGPKSLSGCRVTTSIVSASVTKWCRSSASRTKAVPATSAASPAGSAQRPEPLTTTPNRGVGWVWAVCVIRRGKHRWLRHGSPSRGGGHNTVAEHPSMYCRRPRRSSGPPNDRRPTYSDTATVHTAAANSYCPRPPQRLPHRSTARRGHQLECKTTARPQG
eukprot:TRINITY_DN19505_c0_g1_i1.p2 TRINITY_DN19505_c0_g1~~TRINITY_DN19505_c0_g1_i1.p2  ORF type:complete len:163 (-),score=10.05 TRINITY_DN19505_c0_g1_i1:266-754(-)